VARRIRGWVALPIACCALLALAATASAKEVLYGAGSDGDGGSPSTLYILNPSTGGVLQSIGPIGFSVTGLAVDPTDGTLFGSTGRATSGGATNPGSLVKINRTTGAGTLVGDVRPDTEAAGDITFTPGGALFGWLVPTSNDLVTIDKGTAAASIVGDSGIGTIGSGLASSPSGILLHAALDSGPLYAINPATGVGTAGPTLSGTSGLQIPALSFNTAGTLFGSRLDYGSTGPRPSELITIDTTTGTITSIGPSVSRLDALAFADSTRTITFEAAKKKARKAASAPLTIKRGGKVRLFGNLSAKSLTGCEANQTVGVQRRKPKQATFTTFAQVQTDAGGNFSITKRVKKTFLYRAVVGETTACGDAASNSNKVRAKTKK
jgi:hypothetical protein